MVEYAGSFVEEGFVSLRHRVQEGLKKCRDIALIPSDDLTEFNGFLVRSQNIKVANAAAPIGRYALYPILNKAQIEFPSLIVCLLDIGSVERNVIECSRGTGGVPDYLYVESQISKSEKHGLFGFSVGINARNREPKFLIEVDCCVKVLSGDTNMFKYMGRFLWRKWSVDGN